MNLNNPEKEAETGKNNEDEGKVDEVENGEQSGEVMVRIDLNILFFILFVCFFIGVGVGMGVGCVCVCVYVRVSGCACVCKYCIDLNYLI